MSTDPREEGYMDIIRDAEETLRKYNVENPNPKNLKHWEDAETERNRRAEAEMQRQRKEEQPRPKGIGGYWPELRSF